MVSKSNTTLLAFSILAASQLALARERWPERDGHAVRLHPRRFGQEHPAVIDKISTACPGQVCGNLAGQAITPLLAAQPECSQQDMADTIIDAGKQFDATTQSNMIMLAIEYRQTEKNTPPDFSVNPPASRNSVFCQKAPKNPQLNGLVQAQDPANDPSLFFDPATKATVKKGDQPNTFPFSGNSTAVSDSVYLASSATSAAARTTISSTDTAVLAVSSATTSFSIVGDTTASVPSITSTASSSGVGNFGKCSVPKIEFGNIIIIIQFICDTLTNSCGADQTAKDTCASAMAAASAAKAGTGFQADAFNAVFGITTNFGAVASVDNQGNIIPGTGNGTTLTVPDSGSGSATTTGSSLSATAKSLGGIGDFGKCTVPQIEFGVGFDNRKETSFQPVDKTSYNHGSAQNIDIITQFICDNLVNSCGADATSRATCASAKAAADTAAAKTGAQADKFNAVFGIKTNFASVSVVDDKGNVISANFGSASTTANKTMITKASVAVATKTTSASGNTSNLQTFTQALGAVSAPVITALGSGHFQVEGNAVFSDRLSALSRSCDVQNNQCADAANASGNQNGFTVAACNTQQRSCLQSASISA
ncbi:hypothetical protein J132_10131 [Termitomyces sp. J132]|nr:hypothetical protein J132_10131 [Termitomyces sp. J132]